MPAAYSLDLRRIAWSAPSTQVWPAAAPPLCSRSVSAPSSDGRNVSPKPVVTRHFRAAAITNRKTWKPTKTG